MFLHFGVLHLMFNMWVLWSVGRLAERLVGNLAFATAYLASGLLGSVASVVWNQDVVSAGASGAVFGVFGLLVGFLSLHKRSIPLEVIKQHRDAALAFLIFNLLFGFSIAWIDMAAHVGGLLAGFGCGLFLSQEISPQLVASRRIRTALFVSVCLAVCAVAVVLLPVETGSGKVLRARTETLEQQAGELGNELLKQWRKGSISAEDASRRIEEDVVAEYNKLRTDLQEMEAAGNGNRKSLEQLDRFIDTRIADWNSMARAFAADDPAELDRAVTRLNEGMEDMPQAPNR
jgi:rhomboid protease GluP